MEVLSNESLEKINGGGKSLWFIIGGLVAFLSGFVNGLVNPSKCNN